MNRLILALFVLTLPAMAVAESDGRLPQKYWDYMDGYRYKYTETCNVGWHERSASFLVSASCPELSNEKLNRDAIKSIEYARSKSNAKNFSEYYREIEVENRPRESYSEAQARFDAIELWRQTCVNSKSMNFVSANEMAERFPCIDKVHAAKLFANATTTVKAMGGMVNCAEQARYSAEIYASDIDIRANA